MLTVIKTPSRYLLLATSINSQTSSRKCPFYSAKIPRVTQHSDFNENPIYLLLIPSSPIPLLSRITRTLLSVKILMNLPENELVMIVNPFVQVSRTRRPHKTLKSPISLSLLNPFSTLKVFYFNYFSFVHLIAFNSSRSEASRLGSAQRNPFSLTELPPRGSNIHCASQFPSSTRVSSSGVNQKYI